MTLDKIDHVIMVGGSTRIPAVQELVAKDYVLQTQGTTDRRERRLKLTPRGESLEQLLTEGQRRRLGRAYALAGVDGVKMFHKVLLGVIDDADRPRLPKDRLPKASPESLTRPEKSRATHRPRRANGPRVSG